MTADLNQTPRADRLHIAVFGRTNAGKSTLINTLTGQDLAVVSAVAGTTTDPVYKSMELLPLGPVVLIDTAGLDDASELADLRRAKTLQIMQKTDLAILVITSRQVDLTAEKHYLEQLQKLQIPTVLALNDFGDGNASDGCPAAAALALPQAVVNAQSGAGMEKLFALLVATVAQQPAETTLLQGLVHSGDTVILVMPQDIQAPKGRLILPQVQTIRDLLDKKCLVLSVTTDQLSAALALLKTPPALVITDSQVFEQVYALVGSTIPLTSFSVLMSRQKGDIEQLIHGAQAIHTLRPHDRVLIAEACTHHALAGDIAREKLPALLEKQVGGKLNFEHYAGQGFPQNLAEYQLVIHCGACMLNRKNMLSRLAIARAAHVPITNFGVAIAECQGILAKITY